MHFIIDSSELYTKTGLSVIYFYAPWLHLHKRLNKYLSLIEGVYKDIKFYAINVDLHKDLCVRFGVDSIPKILIMEDEGKVIKTISGLPAEGELRTIFNDIYKVYREKSQEKNDKESS